MQDNNDRVRLLRDGPARCRRSFLLSQVGFCLCVALTGAVFRRRCASKGCREDTCSRHQRYPSPPPPPQNTRGNLAPTGSRGVQAEATPPPSPSNASTAQEEEEEAAGFLGEGVDDVSATALSQEESDGDGSESTTGGRGGGGGACSGGGGEEVEDKEEKEENEEEEDTMDSGSTMKDFYANPGSAAVSSSSMPSVGVGVGSAVGSAVGGETRAAVNAEGESNSNSNSNSNSSGGTPAERATKRRRLSRADGADEPPGGAEFQGGTVREHGGHVLHLKELLGSSLTRSPPVMLFSGFVFGHPRHTLPSGCSTLHRRFFLSKCFFRSRRPSPLAVAWLAPPSPD